MPGSGDAATKQSLRWSPVTWGLVILAISVLLALTAPSTADPPQRLGVALLVAGLTIAAFGARDRQLGVGVVGVVALACGVLLLLDGERYLEPVTRLLGVLVTGIGVTVGVAAARSTSRGVGRSAGAVALLAAVTAASLFLFFDREMLSLALGVGGAVVVVMGFVGVVHADAAGVSTRSFTLTQSVSSGAAAIAERASAQDAGESIRDKILYEGEDRPRRFYRFLMLMLLSSAIAALGIVSDSTAVVIGAMLVAPLLVPLMGMSLSLVVGWTGELRRASAVAGAGVLVAIVTGFVVSAAVGRNAQLIGNAQIASRDSPTMLDLGIAVAAGAAGAYALSRSDISDALPGVAVAIALVPPLVVVGITAQLGSFSDSAGALLLFGTNAVAILLMGALTFLVTGTAAAADRHWRLDWWTVAFGLLTVVVLAGLVVNTSWVRSNDNRNEAATEAVDEWIGDREYDVISVTVDGSEVDVVLAGPGTPDDTDDLAQRLSDVLDRGVVLDTRVALVEQTTDTVAG